MTWMGKRQSTAKRRQDRSIPLWMYAAAAEVLDGYTTHPRYLAAEAKRQRRRQRRLDIQSNQTRKDQA